MKRAVMVVFLCALITGCGNTVESQPVSTEAIDTSVAGADTVVDTEVQLESTTEHITNKSSNDSIVFDESYNSYYVVEDGKAKATAGNATESVEVTEEAENNDVTESAEDEIVFIDGTSKSNTVVKTENDLSNSSDTTIGTGNYQVMSNLTRKVNSTERTLEFVNDSDYSVCYALYDGDKVVFSTGKLAPGASSIWQAYDELSAGYHEYSYVFEQYDGDIVSISYSTTASITVEKE